MDGLITIVCYKNGEIIDGPYVVGYSCPPDRGIFVSTPFRSDPIGGSEPDSEALAEFIYQTYFI